MLGLRMKKAALVVDNEPLVRKFISHILRPLGFDIYDADREEIAWNTFLAHQAEIRFIIVEIDLVFGNGLELYKRIRKINQSVAIALCGDCSDLAHPDVLHDPFAKYLVTPFSVETLIQTSYMIHEETNVAAFM